MTAAYMAASLPIAICAITTCTPGSAWRSTVCPRLPSWCTKDWASRYCPTGPPCGNRWMLYKSHCPAEHWSGVTGWSGTSMGITPGWLPASTNRPAPCSALPTRATVYCTGQCDRARAAGLRQASGLTPAGRTAHPATARCCESARHRAFRLRGPQKIEIHAFVGLRHGIQKQFFVAALCAWHNNRRPLASQRQFLLGHTQGDLAPSYTQTNSIAILHIGQGPADG